MRASAAFLIALIAIYSSGVHSEGDKPTNQFEIDILAAHNKLRAAHGVPPLKWSSKLQKLAQEWANHLTTLKELQHRPNNIYGENLYTSFNMKDAPNGAAVDSWYSEIKDYDFKKNEYQRKAAHFAQVVWKDSKFLGAAKATSGNSEYVVANYEPLFTFEFKANVLPRKSKL